VHKAKENIINKNAIHELTYKVKAILQRFVKSAKHASNQWSDANKKLAGLKLITLNQYTQYNQRGICNNITPYSLLSWFYLWWIEVTSI